MLLASGTLAVGLLLTAGGLGYAYSKYSRLARVQLGSVLTDRSSSSEPQNILLVGVDSAGNLDPDDPVRAGREDLGGLRSDTMMILRVDPTTEQAHLLSLPRDLWVPLASGGRQRINTAIEIGGPSELISTIEGYLGIPVNHYVQVDFAGFRGLVDVVDGIDVWFEAPTRDEQSGLSIEATGCVSLGPDEALAYVRARHLQTLEGGRWRTDPTGDLGRMSRQQDFIVRALRSAVDEGVRNPVTADNLVDAALATVTVDDQLTADDIVGLASRFRSFRPDRLELHALPVVDDTAGGAAILRLVDVTAQPILDLFRGTDREEVAPSSVRVQVLNGSGRAGEASAASEGLAAAGFTAAGTGEAESFGIARTVVRYTAGQDQAADLVARHLVAGAVLEEVPGSVGADVVVVTGADYAGVRSTPAAPDPSSTAPTATTVGSSPTTSSPDPTTTTSVVGLVPVPPEGVSC
ncbi:MAG: LCP family protein [Acidimicrobiales bacterium]